MPRTLPTPKGKPTLSRDKMVRQAEDKRKKEWREDALEKVADKREDAGIEDEWCNANNDAIWTRCE